MIKRTIEISAQPAHLTVKLDQLLIQHGLEVIASVPCEDIGVLLLDHPQNTYSHVALAALLRHDAVTVVCGPDHLPAGLLLPLADHSQVVWRVTEQVSLSRPLRKRLWQQLIRAKVRAQALNLPPDSTPRKKLLLLARQVRSGDPTNVESQAARIYWQHWLPTGPFRRLTNHNPRSRLQQQSLPFSAENEAAPSASELPACSLDAALQADLNALLNYGYAVLRAAVARAIVCAGLLPVIGIHHANRSNAFCLADDLLEPLRPFVDRRVRELYLQGRSKINSDTKRELLQLLAERVQIGHHCGPLMVNLHRLAASLVLCYQGKADRLEIPTFPRKKPDLPHRNE